MVFGVAAEDAERLAAFLQDSLDRTDEADDGGPWPAARGVPSGPAGTERGNLLEDVRGRIPVQGWPEFSESREQLNSSGGTGPDAAHSQSDHGDNGQAAVAGPAGADGPAAGPDDLVVEDDLPYDDEAEHAAWLSGIRASGDADDDDEYCDTADDLRATPHGPGLGPAGRLGQRGRCGGARPPAGPPRWWQHRGRAGALSWALPLPVVALGSGSFAGRVAQQGSLSEPSAKAKVRSLGLVP